MKEKERSKVYLVELFAALVLYMGMLFGSLTLAKQMDAGPLRTVLVASPMLGFGAMIWAIARAYRRMDEFERRLMLENVAIGTLVTVGWTFTYGFLESAGYPKLSMFVIWPSIAAVWGASTCLRNWMAR
jgi:O-antigen/teichoic acid export membrane protein